MKNYIPILKLTYLFFCFFFAFSSQASAQKGLLPYKNKALSSDERTRDLLSRMILEEKVAQMVSINYDLKEEIITEKGTVNIDILKAKYSSGLGQFSEFCKTHNWLDPIQQTKVYNSIQKYFIENTRLGIPAVFHDEGLHGLTAKNATSFPQPIALAGAFNPEMTEKLFGIVSTEARSRGIQQILCPVLDVERDARWGRCEETFGEDPFLIGEMGVAVIKGMQGDHFQDHVVATLKHFAAHSQPENGINCSPVNVSQRILREVFLYPFQQVVKRTNIASVMASYNEVDGVPSHANQWLLNDVLRKEWGFKGYVVSDYFALGELAFGSNNVGHHVASDWKDAARLGIEAGVNIELPFTQTYANIPQLIKEDLVKESAIDSLVYKLLYYKFELGLFDQPYLDEKTADKANGNEKSRELALEAARQSIVMLKNNNGIAPLTTNKIKKLAIIGPNADRVLLGEYFGKPRQFVTVLEGFRNRLDKNVEIAYSEGCKITTTSGWQEDKVELEAPEISLKSIKAAMETARNSDVILLAVGGNEQTSREAWNLNHMGDRTNIDLAGAQNQLIDSLATLNKPIVAVVINGSPIAFCNLVKKADAIFECWYLGQECGNAIADVVLGNYNPSGKLSVSIPRSAAHLPCYYNYKPMSRRGYLFDSVSPLYPFGFGLSYSTFEISDPKLSKPIVSKDENSTVTVNVTNTGKFDGTEVVQLYIRDEVSSVTRPVKELKGFQRVTLKAGETKPVEFKITPESLAFWDIKMNYTVEPGKFNLMVGNSSRDEDLKSIELTIQ